MARQLGRIGGAVLENNLERNGVDLAFSDTRNDTPLLYLDVNNDRVGILTDTPAYTLNVPNTIAISENLETTAGGRLGDINVLNNVLTSLGGPLEIIASGSANLNNFKTPQLEIDGQTIRSYNTNSDLEIFPAGSGQVNFKSNAEIFGQIDLPAITSENVSALGNMKAGEFQTENLRIDDNFSATTESNSNFELRANGTGVVRFENLNAQTNTFTLGGVSSFENINFGSVNQTGSIDVTGNAEFFDIGAATATAPLDVAGSANIGNLRFSGNKISSTDSSGDVSLTAVGTGISRLYNSVNVDGNLHASGDINIDGNLVIGDDSSQDTISLLGEITSDIVPTTNQEYDLGSQTNTWSEVNTLLMNGQNIESQVVNIDGVSLGQGQGNIIYVSQNGDDENVGDHQQRPVRTIRQALAIADTSSIPTVIYVYPGEYQEELPLVVPSNTTIRGVDMRNTAIYPDSDSLEQDVFLLNGETTIENITVQNFYYDSLNDTGYAFRFAPGCVVTTRSPYIQNVTVITKGSQLMAADPRGFDSGDAGKGALVDGAAVNSASEGASMLFHAVTFITPGVDALTMTNGVRVEWLNSFTYFANRGIYAKNGVTGHASYDGSTVQYGAELRAIGSSSIYGNIGVEADGADCLIHLIGHNFGYIGAGKNVTNSSDDVIQQNEIIELNSAKVYSETTDQAGTFKVGDIFSVNSESGETVLNLSNFDVISQNGIISLAGTEFTTEITPTRVNIGNIKFSENTVSSVSGEINFDAADTFNFLTDLNVINDTTVMQNITVNGDLIRFGDDITDNIGFTAPFEQDLIPALDSELDLGSDSRRWEELYASQYVGDNIQIRDSKIFTTETNSDLEIKVSTGQDIVFINDTVIDNNLDVTLDTTLKNTTVVGLTTVSNTLSVSNDVDVTGNLTVNGNIDFNSGTQFGDILFDDNFITTTSSDSDLELRANGTGNVLLQEDVYLYSLSSNTAELASATGNAVRTVDGIMSNGNIAVGAEPEPFRYAFNNPVTTPGTYALFYSRQNVGSWWHALSIYYNGVLVYRQESYNSDPIDYFYYQTTIFPGQAFYGTEGRTFEKGAVQYESSNWEDGGIYFSRWEIREIGVYTSSLNTITTTVTDSDLELRASGTGKVVFENLQTAQNLTVNTATSLLTTNINGSLDHTGSKTQTGNFATSNLNVTGNLSTTRSVQLEEVKIDDNVIASTTTNSDLEFRANGSGRVVTNNPLIVQNNLTTDIINVSSLVSQDVLGEVFTLENIDLFDNVITTTQSNSDLELRSSGTGTVDMQSIRFQDNIFTDTSTITISANNITLSGNSATVVPQGTNAQWTNSTAGIRFNTDDNLFEGYGNNIQTFSQLYSADRNTSVIANSSNNHLEFIADSVQTVHIDFNSINANKFVTDFIAIDANTVSSNETNADIEFRPSGVGKLLTGDAEIVDNILANMNTEDFSFTATGLGHYRFEGTNGVVIPVGDDDNRDDDPVVGEVRWNTARQVMEVYNGTSWILVAGGGESVNAETFENLLFEFTMALG